MVPHRRPQGCSPVARAMVCGFPPKDCTVQQHQLPYHKVEGENVCQKNKFIKCQLNQMSFHIAHGEGQHLMETLAGFAASSLSADGVFIMNG